STTPSSTASVRRLPLGARRAVGRSRPTRFPSEERGTGSDVLPLAFQRCEDDARRVRGRASGADGWGLRRAAPT
ncbi:hypothetical protein ACSNOK_30285, partial [Streptomyces sp. URMC 126]|uniref:hypothetical protein n=1 Tax=Streptomyces sp. URMC 126 TaxID=3423401 RepID=UPI003F19B874